MKEIERLHEKLIEAGIEHEWIDRTPRGYEEFTRRHPGWFKGKTWGWQIIIHKPDGERLVSAIEGYGTYGYEDDKIEIMGLLTPEEEEYNSVAGWLTADEVFQRIREVLG